MDELAQRAVARLKQAEKTLATAESCTGGLLGKLITDVSGSSAVYPGGVISYSNGVKHNLLGVSQENLDAFGAVSEPVARQMAHGARRAIGADIGIGVTGIAGPNSDDTKKPVGLVYLCLEDDHGSICRELHLHGARDEIRSASAQAALELLLEALDGVH
ncbi:MAG: nicotinamide-nucleotide amidohydrolase family protein [Oscillospiraceae bacterium]|nr:nicotinamide-nucleotide amidohydrolase family protein [Oscillospiraceae bacterium]